MICSKPLATKVPVNKAAGTFNLSKKIGLNLSGVIDIDENTKHKELSIYQEKQLNFL